MSMRSWMPNSATCKTHMMEPLLKIDPETCIACYACVRACPVKAIRVQSASVKPEIIPERCIGCGSCLAVCGPGAIGVRDAKKALMRLLSGKKKVAALVDPSIAGEFPDITDYRKFVQMLRTLGFHRVQEVAFGVDLVARAYVELFQKSRGKYYIMSNDPVTVSFVEKYKPGLVPNLAPILPPVAAIVLAIWSRQVYLSLAGGVWLGWTIMNGWNPLVGFAVTIDELIASIEWLQP